MKNFKRILLKYKWVILIYLIIAITMIPLFKLCASCVPNADDFVYGMKAHAAYRDTGSVWKAVSGAMAETYDKYFTWQGTFSSIFIMSLHPGVFSLELYCAAAVVLLILSIIMPIILALTVSKYILKGALNILLCIAGVYSFLTLQFMPSIFEGIYWFNGAWYYTFTFNLFLLWVSFIIIYMQMKNQGILRILLFAVLILLAIYFGGTNYPMVVMLTVASSFFMLLVFVRKHEKRWYLFVIWAVLGLCIAINVFAPGNMANYRSHVNLRYTFLCMMRHFLNEISRPAILLTLATCCLMIPFGRKIVINSKIKFVRPILFLIAATIALFSMYTPAAFTYHNAGPVRAQNVRMMLMQIIVFASFINYLGYHKDKKNQHEMRPVLCYIVAILCIITVSSESIMAAWSIKAEYSIMGLKIQKFDRRYKEFFELAEDPNVKTIDVDPLPVNEMLMPSLDRFKHFGIIAYYDKEDMVYYKK